MRQLLYSSAVILFVATSIPAQQSPVFEWAENFNCSAFGNAIHADNHGNVYTVGYFSGTGDFDPGPDKYLLTSSFTGYRDVFVQKVNAAGRLVWAIKMGGAPGAEGWAVSVDRSGKVYIAGYFSGTSDFDPGPAVFTLTSHGRCSAFTVKLDSSGAMVWAKSFGGVDTDGCHISAIIIDDRGDVYVKGGFNGIVDFDPGPAEFNLTSFGYGTSDIFLQKLDTAGNLIWVKKAGDTSQNSGFGALTFGRSGTIYSVVDSMLQQIDTEGKLICEPTILNDRLHSIAADGEGNVYGIGSSLHKFDSSGQEVWSKKFPGSVESVGESIALDISGNVYLAGSFSGTIDFDTGPDTFMLTAAQRDVCLLKLDKNGDFGWARNFGGDGYYDNGRAIAVDASGNVYATGCFFGTADFDPGHGNYSLTTSQIDAYVLKWSQKQPTAIHDRAFAPFSGCRFSSSTTERCYTLTAPSLVRVNCYTTNGRFVASLENAMKAPGVYSIPVIGSLLPQGKYIRVVKAGGVTKTELVSNVKH